METLEAICQMPFENLPFQNTSYYKESYISYLNYLCEKNDEKELLKFAYKHRFVIITEEIQSKSFADNLQKLEQFLKKRLFDIFLSFYLNNGLDLHLCELCSHRTLYEGHIKPLHSLLQRFPENQLIINLNESLSKIAIKDAQPAFSGSYHFSRFQTENYYVLIVLQAKQKNLLLWFWSRAFDELFYHTVKLSKISDDLGKLKNSSLEPYIEDIADMVYILLYREELFLKIPQVKQFAKTYEKGPRISKRFTEVYEKGLLKDSRFFYRYGLIPFTNITSDPQKLSKIIVRYGQTYLQYLQREEYGEKLNIEDFNSDQICPLVKLLVYDFKKQQFDEKLLDEGIEYFRNCSLKKKQVHLQFYIGS